MPLTWEDVHDIAFSKPPIGKRGYNQDQVDAFLDQVESGLRDSAALVGRLTDENAALTASTERLRARVAELEAQLGYSAPSQRD